MNCRYTNTVHLATLDWASERLLNRPNYGRTGAVFTVLYSQPISDGAVGKFPKRGL